jgi:hypothetical protein
MSPPHRKSFCMKMHIPDKLLYQWCNYLHMKSLRPRLEVASRMAPRCMLAAIPCHGSGSFREAAVKDYTDRYELDAPADVSINFSSARMPIASARQQHLLGPHSLTRTMVSHRPLSASSISTPALATNYINMVAVFIDSSPTRQRGHRLGNHNI